MSYDERQAADIERIYATNEKDNVEKPDMATEAARIGVTPAKLSAMRSYASLLRTQDSKMKESTIRKRVCIKFKVKLV